LGLRSSVDESRDENKSRKGGKSDDSVATLANYEYGGTMKNQLSVDKDYNLWVLLHQTTDAALRARQKELDQFDISVIEVGVLVVIQAIGERATPSEISRRIFREPHTVSALLNRMEKKGLLTKTQDLDRKNMVRVSITEKGRQAYDKSTRRKSIYRIISSLSEEERQQLRSCLEKLRNKAFKELTVEHKPPPLPQY